MCQIGPNRYLCVRVDGRFWVNWTTEINIHRLDNVIVQTLLIWWNSLLNFPINEVLSCSLESNFRASAETNFLYSDIENLQLLPHTRGQWVKNSSKIIKISHAIIAMKWQALYPYNDWISGLIRSNPQCYITRTTWHVLSVLSDWCTVIWYQCRHVLPHWSMSEHPLIYYDGMYLGICAIIHVLRLG